MAQLVGLYNTPTASLQMDKTHSVTKVQDITLNNLMVRVEYCWSFGEKGNPFIAIEPRSEVVVSDRVLSMVQIEVSCVLMLN